MIVFTFSMRAYKQIRHLTISIFSCQNNLFADIAFILEIGSFIFSFSTILIFLANPACGTNYGIFFVRLIVSYPCHDPINSVLDCFVSYRLLLGVQVVQCPLYHLRSVLFVNVS